MADEGEEGRKPGGPSHAAKCGSRVLGMTTRMENGGQGSTAPRGRPASSDLSPPQGARFSRRSSSMHGKLGPCTAHLHGATQGGQDASLKEPATSLSLCLTVPTKYAEKRVPHGTAPPGAVWLEPRSSLRPLGADCRVVLSCAWPSSPQPGFCPGSRA